MGLYNNSKPYCVFYGGGGTKAGSSNFSGCTYEWLESKNFDASSLFNTDGGPLVDWDGGGIDQLTIEEDGQILRTASAVNAVFIDSCLAAGIGAGMLIYRDDDLYLMSYLQEIVSISYDAIGLDFSWFEQTYANFAVIGGASNSFTEPLDYGFIDATLNDCYYFVGKDVTLSSTYIIPVGGTINRSSLRIIGYTDPTDLFHLSEDGADYISAFTAAKLGFDALPGPTIELTMTGEDRGLGIETENIELHNLKVTTSASMTGWMVYGPTWQATPNKFNIRFQHCSFQSTTSATGLFGWGQWGNIIVDDCYFQDIPYWAVNIGPAYDKYSADRVSRCFTRETQAGIISPNIENCIIYKPRSIPYMGNTITHSIVYRPLGTVNPENLRVGKNNRRALNNIFYLDRTGPLENMGIWRLLAESGAMEEDYNCYFDAANPDLKSDTPDFFGEIDALARAWKPGVQKHGFFADPMFVDPENYDFRLRSSSPCLGTGKPVNGLATDIGMTLKEPDRVGVYGQNKNIYGV